MKTQQIVFQEYVDGVRHAGRLVEALEADMVQALETWSLAPVVRSLRALRGGNLIVAMTVCRNWVTSRVSTHRRS